MDTHETQETTVKVEMSPALFEWLWDIAWMACMQRPATDKAGEMLKECNEIAKRLKHG